jgi:hypothetical protein
MFVRNPEFGRRGYAAFVVFVLGCGPAPNGRVVPDSAAVVVSEQLLPRVDSNAPKLLPIDQADASFRSFRDSALKALSRRDTSFLYSILTPDIKNSFGGDDSIAGFKRIWRMDVPSSGVWSALSRVLRMGGKLAADSTFTTPYVYAFWPDTVDAFDYVAVTASDAPFHAQPNSGSTVMGTLSHAILKLEEWRNLDESGVATDTTWAHLALPDGGTGWVKGVDVYSPIGWRAFFVKRNGRWLMQLFVAGD